MNGCIVGCRFVPTTFGISWRVSELFRVGGNERISVEYQMKSEIPTPTTGGWWYVYMMILIDQSLSMDSCCMIYSKNVVSIFHVSPYPLVASHRKWSVPLEVVAKCGLVVIVVVGWLDGTEVQFLEGVYKQLCVFIYISPSSSLCCCMGW